MQRLAKFGARRRARSWPLCMLAAAWPAAAEEPARSSPQPFTIEASHTADALANVSGGRRKGERLLGKTDLTVDFDGDAGGAPGWSAHLNLQLVTGKAFSEPLVGDAQVTSNIEASSALRPFEAWVERRIESAGLAFKAGLIDLNGEFDVQSVGALFLNSSHGIGSDFAQSGLNGPSIFPTTSPAFVASAEHGGWTARAGVFDAVAGDPEHPKRTRIRFPGKQGLLFVGEIDRALGEAARVRIGGWSYTSRFDSVEAVDASGEPLRKRGSAGGYGMIEGRLAGAPDGRTLDGWARLGFAAADVNPIGAYAGGGVAYGDDESRIGLAVSHARLGDPARRAAAAREGFALERAETNLELSWARVVAPWLTIQPDLQYVINPGWDPGLRNALVAGVRFQFSYP